MSVEKIKIKDLPSKDSVLETDIFVESDKLKTYKVTADDIAKYVSTNEHLTNKYVPLDSKGVANGVAPLNSDKKINGTYITYGNTTSTSYEGSAGKILETNLDNHILNESNPHKVTKTQVGLGNVENKSSATIRSEITKNNVTTALGYTPYTPNEIDNKLATLETNIDWKESVATYSDIATTYPNPADGWTVNVKDTDYTYRYNGTSWVAISANAIPKATNSVDGLLSKEDHINYEDANNKKHTHSNKTVIDGITDTLVSNWNVAKTHADSAHAPSNAQENVIETVKVNGTALTPSSKSVNVVIPTKVSELTNDSGFKTTDNNTTYSLSKSGSTITLTGSDGSTTSVTDSSGSAGSSVSFTQNLVSGTKVGTLTIDGTNTDLYAPTDTDTHYTTGLKVGASNTATSNAAATNGNVYMNVLDNTTVRDSHKIVGSGATKVTSDVNGVITISSTDTNTTYSTATTSANGLMSSTDKAKLDYTNIVYGTCSTEAATAEKVITISGNENWTLKEGAILIVKFTITNTASSVTLNVNNTGAKSIWYNTSAYTGSSSSICGAANKTYVYVYNGTYWVWISGGVDYDTTYSPAKLGQGYGTCATAASTTAKVVTLSNYVLVTGGIVSVKFTYAVPASATMNINSKGAKAIYYRGAAITAGVINAGDIATFIYNGSQYHLLAVDKNASGIAGQVIATSEPTSQNVVDHWLLEF